MNTTAANRSGVPDSSRPTIEHRRGRLAAHQTRRHRGPALPVTERQAPHPTYPAAHRGHATAPQRCRHLRDRTLARPRKRRDHPDLPARRPGPEGKRARPNRSTVNAARALPPARRPTRLPRSHLNMPRTYHDHGLPPGDYADPDHRLGIIRGSAYSRQAVLHGVKSRRGWPGTRVGDRVAPVAVTGDPDLGEVE